MNLSNPNLLLITGAICMLMSLGLAWLSSLILYAKMSSLKKIFPATHQLIRAHIDYMLMFILLVAAFFLQERFEIVLPSWVIVLLCVGSLYNPFGFIILAIKPELANPKTFADKAKTLLGFLPATLGYGYLMIALISTLIG
ncbi:hypothetical protein A3715_09940 [Oleiphilus sp. HI0009]|uniref:hypothetical protein n=1 Tax=unclassified Oleiphilus TaxID=2631174 RepID=UPI0007C3AE81|nr:MULTISPECIES: hypothetical protein [unclassified Oleiphilus]KZX78580.1 hypothetical protein A3715_09940 [Oleiphilus sp. HI0009]KZY63800.1 hypothetical protein A3738_11550 [Oleiphilus sp. HI0066]KZY70614.1 hypothetical protein A3739_06390 [Oleiphilus sp. HI0067]